MNLTTKLAAALLQMRDAGGERIIPHDDAKKLTSAQIVSLFQFDHDPIRRTDGGPDEAWNLTPRLIRAHRIKTAKIDQPAMAKDRRIDDKWSAFTRAMAEGRKLKRAVSSWPKRKLTGSRRSKRI